jgi:hypothetical protein
MSNLETITSIVEAYASASTVQAIGAADAVLDCADALVKAKATPAQIRKATVAVASLPHVSMSAKSAATRLLEARKYVKSLGGADQVRTAMHEYNLARVEDGLKLVTSLQNAGLAEYCGLRKAARTVEAKVFDIEKAAATFVGKHDADEAKAYALAIIALVTAPGSEWSTLRPVH